MSRVWITSDWHLGHSRASIWRDHPEGRKFSSFEEHDNLVINNYLEVVRKRDTVWFLGDMAMSLEALARIKALPGYKRLVIGNHDAERGGITIQDLVNTFDRVYGLASYKDAWLSHAPIHPNELRGKFNIHGHVHTNTVPDTRYFNACLENTYWYPIEYQAILKRLKMVNQCS